MSAFLRIENVSFFYGHAQVLKEVSLSVEKGSVLCVLGKSGTGKSTLLRVIAGILRPSSGRVLVDGRNRTGVPMHEREELGYVFQSGEGLFPHLTVYQNVAFPFSHGRRSLPHGRQWQSAVTDMLDCVGLVEKKNAKIWELSGGMAQRVALARSLVYEPDILLLDEPLGSLDNALKAELTDLLRTLQGQLGTTFVYVTHDEREALAFGTHIAVMDRGRVAQEGTPGVLLSKPKSANVARLIGGWNVLEYDSTARNMLCDGEKQLLSIAQEQCAVATSSSSSIGIPISKIRATNEGNPHKHHEDVLSLPVNILRVQSWYDATRVVTRTKSGQIVTATAAEQLSFQEDQTIALCVRKEHIHAFQD